ncbi:MAG TPA: helix-turn-helix domain-containing protein [Myxococcota bacterium]|nr:helix-turn-helix domain-containing protein [Myxococcota bacterium]
MTGSETGCEAFRAAMDVLGRPWNGVLLRALQAGPMRFSELASQVGVADRMLSCRLKELEAGGLVSRHVDPGPPVRVSYALTPLGTGIDDVQRVIARWGEELLAARVEVPTCPSAGGACDDGLGDG